MLIKSCKGIIYYSSYIASCYIFPDSSHWKPLQLWDNQLICHAATFCRLSLIPKTSVISDICENKNVEWNILKNDSIWKSYKMKVGNNVYDILLLKCSTSPLSFHFNKISNSTHIFFRCCSYGSLVLLLFLPMYNLQQLMGFYIVLLRTFLEMCLTSLEALTHR